MTRYRTIVADPPWDYGADNERQVSITHNGKGPRQLKSIGYSTMSIEEIGALDVARSLADDDCRLFLWTTNKHLPLAFGVMEAWGFEYRQTIVWHKTGNPSPFGGSVAPNHAEYLLVGVKGSPEIKVRLKGTVIAVPAPIYGHSEKPEAFLDLAEQVSPGPFLEMFSRRNRMGWDAWGDEALDPVAVPA